MIQFIKYLFSELVISIFFKNISKNFKNKAINKVSEKYFSELQILDIYSEITTFKSVSNSKGHVNIKKDYFNVQIIDVKKFSITVAYDYTISIYKANNESEQRQSYGGFTEIYKEDIFSVKK